MNTRLPIERARVIVEEGLPFGPREHPCVCGAGRASHAGDQCTGACKASQCRRYRPDLAYQLAYDAIDGRERKLGQSLREADKIVGAKRRKANPVLPGQWRIGVSDADTCPRKIWYRNKPPEDFVPAWEDRREAMIGSALHDWAESLLKILYPWREFETNIEVPGLDRESRFDWYDQIIETAGDIKTAGDWRWDKLGDEGPDEDTWDKVQIYALALNAIGKPVKWVRLDYIKRANGHDEKFIRPYDEQAAKRALDRLLGYAQSLDLDLELPKTGTGPTNDPLCARCFARNHCWNIPAAQQASRSPESYTILGAAPVDDDVIWAIGQRVEAGAARLAAEKAEKEAKTLLEGVSPGSYGDYEGYETNGGSAPSQEAWKAYTARLREWLGMPKDAQPRPELLPGDPQSRSYTYVKWTKKRKATRDRERAEGSGAA